MADFLKDYEPVEDRLRAFWMDHPQGRVMTTLISHADGAYIVFAEVWRSADEYPAASGLAHDSEAQLPSNMKTSALEVCETSAIGRALANLGYAAKGRRPSREEMSKTSPAAGPPSGVATKGEDRLAGELQGGSPAGGTSSGEGENPSSPAGSSSPGTSLAEGEAAGTEPGGGSSSLTPPGFPIDPANCNHKGSSGRWLPTKLVDGQARCPRCGESALIYRESA